MVRRAILEELNFNIILLVIENALYCTSKLHCNQVTLGKCDQQQRNHLSVLCKVTQQLNPKLSLSICISPGKYCPMFPQARLSNMSTPLPYIVHQLSHCGHRGPIPSLSFCHKRPPSASAEGGRRFQDPSDCVLLGHLLPFVCEFGAVTCLWGGLFIRLGPNLRRHRLEHMCNLSR